MRADDLSLQCCALNTNQSRLKSIKMRSSFAREIRLFYIIYTPEWQKTTIIRLHTRDLYKAGSELLSVSFRLFTLCSYQKLTFAFPRRSEDAIRVAHLPDGPDENFFARPHSDSAARHRGSISVVVATKYINNFLRLICAFRKCIGTLQECGDGNVKHIYQRDVSA